jgi:hypothetical protein
VTHLDVALAARAYRDGRAWRTAGLRHRHLVAEPLMLVLWQLGAEPFSAAAVGFGTRLDDRHMAVAGEPRNRDLLFAALLGLADWFNPRFEAPAATREAVRWHGDEPIHWATSAPQVVVANQATMELLGRLGRRLAYLPTSPTDGRRPAPAALVRLGQHLLFLHRHAAEPGQQLIVALTDLLGAHWATPQSELERASLPALDAFIDPPGGVHGFHAAAVAELRPAGPLPAAEDDQRLEALVEEFNGRRAGRTDLATVRPLLRPIAGHYRPLMARTWELVWRCMERERGWPEAPSVDRRWAADRQAYTDHIDWTARDGRRRTRQTSRQAAMTMRRLEQAKTRVQAEEACDDPVRMIPYLLDHKAVAGEVVRVDPDYRERATVNLVRRPLVTIVSTDPCPMPRGKQLWWAEQPAGPTWIVHATAPTLGGGTAVTLKRTSSDASRPLPMLGAAACFAALTTKSGWLQPLPPQVPWTHQPAVPPPAPGPIEAEQEAAG